MATMGVVIVTYNRLEKLKIALRCFDAQTYAPSYVLVVDNASTDGTGEYLRGWLREKKHFLRHVVTMESNTGGSGGFYAGLESAMQRDADWIWVSDDDAFPEEDALEQLNRFLETRANATDEISAVCCRVINFGETDYFHRRNTIQTGFRVQVIKSTEQDYEKESFRINCFSYVGTLINKKKLQVVGLTKKDYFISYDDTEHSIRLSKVGEIYCVPAAKIHHDGTGSVGLTWKVYYDKRNRLDMIKNHFPGYVYVFYCLELFVRACGARLIRHNIEKSKIYMKALKDCISGQFGIDAVYHPGWQLREVAALEQSETEH